MSLPGGGLLHRRLLLAGLAGFGAGCAAGVAGAAAPARPFPQPALPAGSRLEALGALQLDPAVIGFGGLSGLHLSDDLRLTAISDLGRWLTGRLVLDGAGRPQGLAALRTGRLRDGAGQPLPRGYSGDAESLARLPGGGWLVGFERWHRIRAYPELDGLAGFVDAPAELATAPANGGLEALAVLRDGRWLLLSESQPLPDAPGAFRAWLGQPGAWMAFGYRPEPDYFPADACPLPEGGALVLERHFSLVRGFRGRLVRLDAAQLAAATPGTVLQGEELLRLRPPLPTDNYEAVSVARYRGRSLVAMLSDDNQNMLQRSLLLLFALVDD